MAQLTFWFEFASTYSYLTAMRIDDMSAQAGVEVTWRPLLLGPIFKAQGLNTSPFVTYEVKGRYMWRDMARRAEGRGLPPFVRPATFPQNGLMAARLTLIGLDDGWGRDFARAVYQAQFADGADISGAETLGPLLAGLGKDAEAQLERARTDQAIKDQLRQNTEEAMAIGIFGAPSFTTSDGEVFWGDDRLEDALDWARRS